MKWIERSYPWLLLFPVVLPVIIFSGFIYPYLVPKTILFRADAALSLAAFALLAASGRAFYWKRLHRPLAWIPAALLALAYAASLHGIGFYHSFWSSFIRGDGLVTFTGVVAGFYLILLEADARFATKLVRGVAAVGSFMALYGIGEWLVNHGRVGGLLGNAAFFAGYLVIAFFATLMSADGLSRDWRRAAYAGAAAEVVAIILSATRGSILALGVVLALSLAFMAFHGGRGKARLWWAGAFAALVVAGGLFYAFRAPLSHVPFSPVARVASVKATDPDIASRLFIWKNMLGEIAKRPLLGVGTEHIAALFNQFYDPTQIQEQWFDRSHNAFIDYAVQYGIGGFILYLALIASLIVAGVRFARSGKRTRGLLFMLLAIAYAVQNFFVFDTVSSFWLLLALLAAALALSGAEAPREKLPMPSWSPYAAGIAAFALVLAIIPISILPGMAAYDLAHAYAYAISDSAKSVGYLSHGYALGTYGDLEYGYEAYDMYANFQSKTLVGNARLSAYQTAENILERNYQRYPYDARTALDLADMLTLAPSGATINSSLLSHSLARAIQESPKRPQAWFLLVNVTLTEANASPVGSQKRLSEYAAAKDVISRYIALVPTLSEPHFVLAQLYHAMGDPADAVTQAVEGKKYYRGDLATAKRAAGYYESVSDWQDAEFFLKEVLSKTPDDYGMRYDLAKVEYLLGNYAQSEQLVQSLRTDDPAILDSDPNFMSAISAYERKQ